MENKLIEAWEKNDKLTKELDSLTKKLEDLEIESDKQAVLPERQWIWHNFKNFEHGLVFVRKEKRLIRFRAFCNYSQGKHYYTFKDRGTELSKEAFFRKYINFGLVTGTKKLVEAKRDFARQKASTGF